MAVGAGKVGTRVGICAGAILLVGWAAVPLRAVPGVAGGAQQVPDGAAMVRALGCGGCHAGVPFDGEIRSVAPPVATSEVPLAPAYIFNYLADPRSVRPDIGPARMPSYDLDERERLALALYTTNEVELIGVDDAFRSAQASHPDVNRGTGKVLFESLGCAGCHTHPESVPRQSAPDLSFEGSRVRGAWLRSYLLDPGAIRPAGPEPGQGGQMPDFRFTSAEAEAIAGFLETLRAPELVEWEPTPLSPFAMQKAETLLRDRWSCLGCHQLGDDGGRIGPRLDGIQDRLRPEFVRAFMEAPAHLAPNTVMPASLEQQDRLDLIASFLIQREGTWSAGEYVNGLPVAAPDSGTPGEALYQRQCALCHGPVGEGDGFNAPFLPVAPTRHADAEAMSARPDDTLYDAVHAGGWILGKSHRMPAFGASLEPEEIRSLVSYIRRLCQCQGPAWSRDGRRGR